MSQTKRDGASASLNDRGQLGIDASLGATDRLGGLAAARFRAVLMQFDVRAIDIPRLTRCSDRHQRQHPREQPRGTPASKPRLDRTLRSKLLRKIAPRAAGAQDVEYRGEHESIVLRRSTPQRPPAGFATRAVNFFRLRHNGSGSSRSRTSFMRAVGFRSLHSDPNGFCQNALRCAGILPFFVGHFFPHSMRFSLTTPSSHSRNLDPETRWPPSKSIFQAA